MLQKREARKSGGQKSLYSSVRNKAMEEVKGRKHAVEIQVLNSCKLANSMGAGERVVEALILCYLNRPGFQVIGPALPYHLAHRNGHIILSCFSL